MMKKSNFSDNDICEKKDQKYEKFKDFRYFILSLIINNINMFSNIFAFVVIIITFYFLSVTQIPSHHYFQSWKNQFGINYQPFQDHFRLIIFERNVIQINKHNANKSNTYLQGVNQFTALTELQFQTIFLKPKATSLNQTQNYNLEPNSLIQIDWVAKGRVSAVKNQGSCASCWAFSAVAILESFALSKNRPVLLSEQQLVDCSEDYGNSGCYGGFNYNALQYVLENGIVQERIYPYQGVTGLCVKDGGDFKIAKVHSVKGCSEIYSAVALRPLGVTVDATKWKTYASGVFSGCDKAINHDVQLVGLSTSYYKIKNSWGTTWGEKGYIRLALGDTCGICMLQAPFVE